MLVAEDRQEDRDLFEIALQKAKVKAAVHFVGDGDEVIAYLEGTGAFADRVRHPLPRMLLLDLKMPRTDGFDVLRWIRRQETDVRYLPVVVFSSSDEEADIKRAYDLGANSFVVKPIEFEKLQDIVRFLEAYWLRLNRYPFRTTQQSFGESV